MEPFCKKLLWRLARRRCYSILSEECIPPDVKTEKIKEDFFMKRISRRQFLKASAAVSAAGVLGVCAAEGIFSKSRKISRDVLTGQRIRAIIIFVGQTSVAC